MLNRWSNFIRLSVLKRFLFRFVKDENLDIVHPIYWCEIFFKTWRLFFIKHERLTGLWKESRFFFHCSFQLTIKTDAVTAAFIYTGNLFHLFGYRWLSFFCNFLKCGILWKFLHTSCSQSLSTPCSPNCRIGQLVKNKSKIKHMDHTGRKYLTFLSVLWNMYSMHLW